MKDIRVGDVIQIVNAGKVYPNIHSADYFIAENRNLPGFLEWAILNKKQSVLPAEMEEGTVRATSRSCWDNPVLIVQKADSSFFCIGPDGVKIISDPDGNY